jgi:hypothetical protein
MPSAVAVPSIARGPVNGPARRGELAAVDAAVADLAAALAVWSARRDDRPDATARRAANTAMDALDAALAELHELRARLHFEIRESDDRTAERVDAMLARRREATP